jgi:hypothetical protein
MPLFTHRADPTLFFTRAVESIHRLTDDLQKIQSAGNPQLESFVIYLAGRYEPCIAALVLSL